VKSLERSLVGHAYLFSGPRGCGKTTAARLLAKALNCLSPLGSEPCCECKNCLAITAGESLDVVEIDGASNNGVDEVRELKTHVTLSPFSSRYKVYIIDEVHMLSIAAFNALLKTLEEPPACVVFILATTEAHKVPVTIRSRCQHIPFHRIGTRDIHDRLTLVCSAEELSFAPEALWEIARQADGALRDALSMLEQIAGLGKDITLSDVETTLGQISRSSMERWLSGCRDGGLETFMELDRLLAGGASPGRFIEELFSLVRNLWLAARWKDALTAIDAPEQEKEFLKEESKFWNPSELESLMRFLTELMPQVRMGLRIDVLGGLLITKLANLRDEPKIADKPKERPKISPKNDFISSSASAAAQTLPRPPVPASQPEAPEATEKPGKPVEQLDSSAWKPYPEGKWSDALGEVREKEFLLYCALLNAAPFVDEGRGNALVLDMGERYCYEVLRLDRHRAPLKNVLSPFLYAQEIVLRCGERWTACNESAAPEDTVKKRNSGKKTVINEPQPVRELEASRAYPAIPFDGLIQEATRWLRAEVIMVRSEESGEGDNYAMDENLIEE